MIRGLPGNGLMRERIEDRGPVVVSDPADVAGADCFPLNDGIHQFFAVLLDSESFDEVVSGSDLDEPHLCFLEITDPVDDCVHCTVPAQYDEAAFFTA